MIHSEMKEREREHRRIQEDVEYFLQCGGTIERFPQGARSCKSPIFNKDGGTVPPPAEVSDVQQEKV